VRGEEEELMVVGPEAPMAARLAVDHREEEREAALGFEREPEMGQEEEEGEEE